MIRRAFLRRVLFAAAGLAAGTARADPVDEIMAEIRDQGFDIVRVQRTWLGRVRIIAQNESFRREVVIDPTTGEIRRDLLIPRKPPRGSSQPPAEAPAQPDLGTSRGVGPIEDEPPGTGGTSGGADDDDAHWGGGWGSQGAPTDDGGEGDSGGGADAR